MSVIFVVLKILLVILGIIFFLFCAFNIYIMATRPVKENYKRLQLESALVAVLSLALSAACFYGVWRL